MVALACAIALPATAFGAEPAQLPVKPFTLTAEAHAKKPNLGVDDNGTGHFVWDVDLPYPQGDPAIYCRVPRGASACQTNINCFEAARVIGASQVVYASSAAVYGMEEDGEPLDEAAACEPSTHYGVFKRTNEGNARVYFLDHGLNSIALRPLTVYGVNRDAGLTSDPTKAMKAAILKRPFHIRFGGATDFQYVADTAAAFIACADSDEKGAHVFNLHGETIEIERISSFINQEIGSELVTCGGPPIPIAPSLSDGAIRRVIGDLPSTPFETGIRETMSRFAALHESGRLDTRDIEPEA